jgi:predicted RNase H-like HicB family nuclease
MRVYWDTTGATWVASWPDGYECILTAKSEAQAVLEAQMMEEDEGVMQDE